MKWYKQSSEEYDSKANLKLLAEFGPTGPLLYYYILQMCARLVVPPKDPNKPLKEEDMVFEINLHSIASSVLTKPIIVVRCLDHLRQFDLLTFDKNGMMLIIKMPKLLKLLTADQKKSRQNPEDVETKSGLRYKSIDKEELKEKINKKEKPNTGVFLSEIENLYFLFYPRKVGKTKGVQKLSRDIKTEQDLADLKKAINNYAKLCVGKDTEYIKHFSTFAGCWRDYVDEIVETTTTETEIADLFAQYGEEND